MKPADIIRAWKDETYLAQLSDSDKAQLPKNPAGFIELSDEELTGALGNGLTLPPPTAIKFCNTVVRVCPPQPQKTKTVICLTIK